MEDEMIKVELPIDEWIKMEAHHEIIENFKEYKELDGYDEAVTLLLQELNEFLGRSPNDHQTSIPK